MNKKMAAVVMAAAVAFGACKAVWADESHPIATREVLHSDGRIVYQEGDNKVVLDAQDLYKIADRLDLFKRGVSSQLAKMGTYLTTGDGAPLQTNAILKVTHINPAAEHTVDPLTVDFNALLEGVAASQSVSDNPAAYGYEAGAVLYRMPDGTLTTAGDGTGYEAVSIKPAAAENLSAGTAAWVDGHLLLGNGSDNKAYYDKGHGQTGDMIGNIISLLYSGVNETKSYTVTGKNGSLGVSIDSKDNAGPNYVYISSESIPVWNLEGEEKRLLTKLQFQVSADTAGVRDGDNSISGSAYINYTVYDQNGKAIGSGRGKAKEPLIIDAMALPITTQNIYVEADGEVYVSRNGHECGHGSAYIDFHGMQATYLIN